MSLNDNPPPTLADLADHAGQLACDLAWRQWTHLNPNAMRESGRSMQMNTIIDPEILVMATGMLWQRERRLLDIMAGWARVGSRLLSVQRIRTLLKAWEEWGSAAGEPFAQLAEEYGDNRWRTLANRGIPEPAFRAGKGPEHLTLDSPAAVVLRIRAAFGVSSKADIFTYLLSLQGEARTASEIADAVTYSSKVAREAADDLVLAGFAEAVRGGYPLRYSIRPSFAVEFIDLIYMGKQMDGVPSWHPWDQIFGLLLEVSRWPERAKGPVGTLALSMWARETCDRYHNPSRHLHGAEGFHVPDPRRYPGVEYLEAFRIMLEQLGARLIYQRH